MVLLISPETIPQRCKITDSEWIIRIKDLAPLCGRWEEGFNKGLL